LIVFNSSLLKPVIFSAVAIILALSRPLLPWPLLHHWLIVVLSDFYLPPKQTLIQRLPSTLGSCGQQLLSTALVNSAWQQRLATALGNSAWQQRLATALASSRVLWHVCQVFYMLNALRSSDFDRS